MAMFRNVQWGVCLLLTLGPFAGCAVHRHPSPHRSELAPDVDFSPSFPPRRQEPAAELLNGIPPVVHDRFVRRLIASDGLSEEKRVRLIRDNPPLRVLDKRLTEHGLLGMYARPSEDDDSSAGLSVLFADLIRGFDANAAFVSSYDLDDPIVRLESEDSEGFDRLLRHGIGLFIPTSIPPDAKGVLIRHVGLSETRYERAVRDAIAARGWVVMDVESRLSLRPTDEKFIIAAPEHVPAVGRAIGAAVDDLLAEHVYAVRAGLDALYVRFPELERKPLAVIGFSGGALVAPTVAASLGPERLCGVGVVAGGAHLLAVSEGSRRKSSDPDIHWAPGVDTPENRELLLHAYLQGATLDPYHAAPALAGVPVLQVQGAFDRIVPSESGWLLCRRLGRPDRLVFLIGHRGVFFLLPTHKEWIASWFERAGAAWEARRAPERTEPILTSGSSDGAGTAGGHKVR